MNELDKRFALTISMLANDQVSNLLPNWMLAAVSALIEPFDMEDPLTLPRNVKAALVALTDTYFEETEDKVISHFLYFIIEAPNDPAIVAKIEANPSLAVAYATFRVDAEYYEAFKNLPR